ncbi:MAG: hypothetical protein Q8N56_02030, partial [bacterium]|nr:hypothetical protein [bacterium]
CLPSNRGSFAGSASLSIEGKSFKGYAFLLRIPSFLKHFGFHFIPAFLLVNPFSTTEGTRTPPSLFAPKSLRGQKRFPH